MFPSTASPSERPFSPSPPRENKHSGSRPPSLLFGAPPVGLVASSVGFSLEGLPSTPTPLVDRELQSKPAGHYFAHSHRNSIGGRQSDGTVAGVFVAMGSSRQRSSSVSTTSSGSPPLGATSILATLQPLDDSPMPSSGPQTPSIISSTSSRRIEQQSGSNRHSPVPNPANVHPTATILPSLDNNIVTGTAKSVSAIAGLPFSRSMPRIHQPTVLRGPSGRGVAFVPSPPSQLAPSSTKLAIHRPGVDRKTSKTAEGAVKEVTKRMLNSETNVDIGNDNLEQEPVQLDRQCNRLSISSMNESEGLDLDPNETRESATRKEVFPEVLGDKYNPRNGALPPSIGEVHSTSMIISNADALLLSGDSSDQEQELHEVLDVSSEISTAFPPEYELYVPPYQPRSTYRRSSTFAVLPSKSNPIYSVTVHASLGRQTQDGLPFSHRRVEFKLTWPEYSHGPWYSLYNWIPDWQLRIASGKDGQEVRDSIVKSIVSSLPFIGRFAAWL